MEIVKYITDSNGRFVIADIIADSKKFTLFNLYAPNEDKSEFFDEIFDTLKEFDCESIIIGGNFNCILSSDVDKQGGRLDSKPNSRASLLSYIENYDLSDIWKNLNPNTKRYTWHSANGKIQCRLDYFLISQSLNGFVNNAEIAPGFKTDHSLVQLSLIKGNQPRGKGFWKFNSSLLSNLDYVNAIKSEIKETIEQNQNLHALLLWDFLKCQIRGKTISFSSLKSKQRRKQENILIAEILSLEKRLVQSPTVETKKLVDEKMKDLETLIEPKLLESCYAPREEENFYTNLYSPEISNFSKEELEEANIYFLSQQTSASLNPNEVQLCEGEISERECLENLKAMPNGESPGTDRFSAEFYKVFWIDLKDILLSCYVAAFRTGKMSISQRRGIITLIPKKNSVPFLLKNWRPISLLNTNYKIATRCIASRLKQVLSSIIHPDQTGYLKGRYIGENVILLFGVIEHAQENEIPGLLFFADFEKAFDTLNHNFILQALNFFKFGNDLKQWISVFFTKIAQAVSLIMVTLPPSSIYVVEFGKGASFLLISL